MAEEFNVKKTNSNIPKSQGTQDGNKIIDEANYRIRAPKEKGPTAVGRGGDPLFRRINATKEQLLELMEETQTVQDWVQRETCNNVALNCLESQDLKETYFLIKDGFEGYGKISLMGFKTPAGVEIPRLKIFDKDGEVIEVLTGPMAIDEIQKRGIAYKNSHNKYEAVPIEGNEPIENIVIEDYTE